jgi:hypothetical protein
VAKVLTAKVVPNLKDGHVANNRFVIWHLPDGVIVLLKQEKFGKMILELIF